MEKQVPLSDWLFANSLTRELCVVGLRGRGMRIFAGDCIQVCGRSKNFKCQWSTCVHIWSGGEWIV